MSAGFILLFSSSSYPLSLVYYLHCPFRPPPPRVAPRPPPRPPGSPSPASSPQATSPFYPAFLLLQVLHSKSAHTVENLFKVETDQGEVKQIASSIAQGTLTQDQIMNGVYDMVNIAGAIKLLLRQASGNASGGPLAANKQTGVIKPDSLTCYDNYNDYLQVATNNNDDNTKIIGIRKVFSSLPNDNKYVYYNNNNNNIK